MSTKTQTTAEQEYSWEATSGLKDDFSMTVANAYFANDPKYANGEVAFLVLEGEADDDSEEVKVRFPAGKKFEVREEGERLVHESGKFKVPNKQSSLGILINRIGGYDPAYNFPEQGLNLKFKSPLDAKTYMGLSFHFKIEKFEYAGKKEDGTPFDPVERLMPVKYLGGGPGHVKEASGTAKTTESKPVVTDAPPEATTPTEATVEAVTDVSAALDQLRKIATEVKARPPKTRKDKPDTKEFEDRAFDEVELVSTDSNLGSKVLDGSLFTELTA